MSVCASPATSFRYPEGESRDREVLDFPPDNQALLDAVWAAASNSSSSSSSSSNNNIKSAKKPVVACIISGGAVDLSAALERADAVVAMYSGGMEAGSGLADVLYGATNPSGVLAATIYRQSWANGTTNSTSSTSNSGASDFLSMAIRAPPGRGHRYLTDAARRDHVLFEFGFGLSYSNWSASVLSVRPSTVVSAAALQAGAVVAVDVAVRNEGGPPGSRVAYAMLSRRDAPAAEEWPREWLPFQGFAKLHGVESSVGRTTSMTSRGRPPPAAAGEQEQEEEEDEEEGVVVVDEEEEAVAAVVTLNVTGRDFSRWVTSAGAFVVQPGTYELRVRDAPPGDNVTVITVTA